MSFKKDSEKEEETPPSSISSSPSPSSSSLTDSLGGINLSQQLLLRDTPTVLQEEKEKEKEKNDFEKPGRVEDENKDFPQLLRHHSRGISYLSKKKKIERRKS